jgi:hypothetical protein
VAFEKAQQVRETRQADFDSESVPATQARLSLRLCVSLISKKQKSSAGRLCPRGTVISRYSEAPKIPTRR